MAMTSNEAQRKLLSIERLDSFWDTLWLELWPFFYFIVAKMKPCVGVLGPKSGNHKSPRCPSVRFTYGFSIKSIRRVEMDWGGLARIGTDWDE